MSGFPLLLMFFAIYAICGWCMEVIYATIDDGKFVNRGFLNGPVCPIYGCGAVLIVEVLNPVGDNLILLFIASIILTTLLELVTGWILERVFNQKWWDYSDEHYQFRGYICLKFSLLWGLACVLLVRVIHPVILKFVQWLPKPVSTILLVVFCVVFVTDLVLTVTSLIKLKKSYRILDEMDALLNRISEEIGEKLYEGTVKGMSSIEESRERLEESKEKLANSLEESKEKLANSLEESKEKLANSLEESKERLANSMEESKERFADKKEELSKELEELVAKYKTRFQGKNLVHNRIRTAFPKLKLPSLAEAMERFERLHISFSDEDEKDSQHKDDE